VRWNKITLVGVGLLGGSLGLALRRRKLAKEIAGYVRREASIKDCERADATDYATTDLLAAVSGADLVVLCTPLAQMKPLVRQMLPALKRGAIVTDVGSVKGSVVRSWNRSSPRRGHISSAAIRWRAARSKVCRRRGRSCLNAQSVSSPRRGKPIPRRCARWRQLWKDVGARLLRTSPDAHDALVSRSSHLPHLMAATLANLVLDPKLPKEQAMLCATGFRDTTRIASGSPEMWRDIALTNRKHWARVDRIHRRVADKFQSALKCGDTKAIAKFFETAKQRRDNWCACCASPSQE
jgi:prephenate dehydrogenase